MEVYLEYSLLRNFECSNSPFSCSFSTHFNASIMKMKDKVISHCQRPHRSTHGSNSSEKVTKYILGSAVDGSVKRQLSVDVNTE